MKKKIGLCAIVCCLFVVVLTFNQKSAAAAVSQSQIQKAKEAYNSYLKNEKYKKQLRKREIKAMKSDKPVKMEKGAFSLLDVDKNGMPELLYTPLDFQNNEYPVHMYTFQSGKVKYLGRIEYKKGEFGDWARLYYSSAKKELLLAAGDITSSFRTFKYNGKKLIDGSYRYYEENEYAAAKKFKKKNKFKMVRFHYNTEKKRIKIFKVTELDRDSITIQTENKVVLKLINNKKKVKWSIDKKSIAKITVNNKNKITIVPKKTGKAKITAKVGTRKYVCRLTVKAGSYSYVKLDDGTIGIDGYRGWESDLVIPEEIDGFKVSIIGLYAFSKNKVLKSVEISKGIEGILEGSFFNCTNLESVKLPDTITSIGPDVFSGTKWLKKMRKTSDNHIVIVNNVLLDGKEAEGKTIIPTGAAIVAEGAFQENKNITSVVIPKGITKISQSAFNGCGRLEEVQLPEEITDIDEYAFSYCYNLKDIHLPSSVRTLGTATFRDCTSLESIKIPEGITAINEYCFYGCVNLKSVEIPKTVTQFGGEAFKQTKWLEEEGRKAKDGLVIINNILIDGTYAAGDIVVPEGVKIIASYAFSECVGMNSLTISEGVTTIESYILNFSSKLEYIKLPKSVTEISIVAFMTIDTDPVLYVINGSYAYEYAMEVGMEYRLL